MAGLEKQGGEAKSAAESPASGSKFTLGVQILTLRSCSVPVGAVRPVHSRWRGGRTQSCPGQSLHSMCEKFSSALANEMG